MQHSLPGKRQGESSHSAAEEAVPTQASCQHNRAPPPASGHSLRVQLVQGAIHTHGNLQVLKSLVLSPFFHDGSQARTTELGSPPGHSSTHLLHHDAVLTCAVQAQLLQDPPDLEEGQPVTVGEQGQMLARGFWRPGTHSA